MATNQYQDLIDYYSEAAYKPRLVVEWLTTTDYGQRLLKAGVYDPNTDGLLDMRQDFPAHSSGERTAWAVIQSLWLDGPGTTLYAEDWDRLEGTAGTGTLLGTVADVLVKLLHVPSRNG
jgi:hypothetical protein